MAGDYFRCIAQLSMVARDCGLLRHGATDCVGCSLGAFVLRLPALSTVPRPGILLRLLN